MAVSIRGINMERQKYKQEDDKNALDKSDAHGKSYAGAGPYAGSGCKSADLVTSGHDDGSGAQKTDAVDDLRSKPGDICCTRKIHINILTRQHNESGTQADKGMGLNSCSPPLDSAVKPNETSNEKGNQKTDKNIDAAIRKYPG